LHKSELQSVSYEQIIKNCQSNYIYAIDKLFLWVGLMYKKCLGKSGKGTGVGYRVKQTGVRLTAHGVWLGEKEMV
jgi:hypothetical protein